MLERANLTLRNGSWSNWFGNGGDWSDRLTTRNALIFGGGAMLALVTARLASPLAGRAIGSMRAMIGADPFAALTQDHRRMLALFDRIEKTDGSAAHQRNAMLLQLKRMLTAHALAEEDIIYPMLCDDAGRSEQARKLYRDHAEIKVRLFELEHMRMRRSGSSSRSCGPPSATRAVPRCTVKSAARNRCWRKDTRSRRSAEEIPGPALGTARK